MYEWNGPIQGSWHKCSNKEISLKTNFNQCFQQQIYLMRAAGRAKDQRSKERRGKKVLFKVLMLIWGMFWRRRKMKPKKKENGYSWMIVLLKVNINQSLYWFCDMWVVWFPEIDVYYVCIISLPTLLSRISNMCVIIIELDSILSWAFTRTFSVSIRSSQFSWWKTFLHNWNKSYSICLFLSHSFGLTLSSSNKIRH